MILVVLYGYQGSDDDAEQLALTDQLFDAALAELAVVAWGSPCLLVGDFNVEPTEIPCLSKGISAGLLLGVCSLMLRVSVVGFLLVVVLETFWLVVLWLLLLCSPVLFVLAGGCSLTSLLLLRLIVKGGLAG